MGALVTVVTALALVVGVVTALSTGALRTGVRVLLDLLTAAGLLRLAGDPAGTAWPARSRSSPCVNCSGRR